MPKQFRHTAQDRARYTAILQINATNWPIQLTLYNLNNRTAWGSDLAQTRRPGAPAPEGT
jgi:hypothetical protein